MRLPTVKAADVMRALEKAGFQKVRQSGAHVHFKHPDGRLIPVPLHPGQDIGRGLLRKIIRDMAVTRKEFLNLLKDP